MKKSCDQQSFHRFRFRVEINTNTTPTHKQTRGCAEMDLEDSAALDDIEVEITQFVFGDVPYEERDYSRVKGTHFSPQLMEAISGVFSSNDPIDLQTFNPIDYINHLFPNGLPPLLFCRSFADFRTDLSDDVVGACLISLFLCLAPVAVLLGAEQSLLDLEAVTSRLKAKSHKLSYEIVSDVRTLSNSSDRAHSHLKHTHETIQVDSSLPSSCLCPHRLTGPAWLGSEPVWQDQRDQESGRGIGDDGAGTLS